MTEIDRGRRWGEEQKELALRYLAQEGGKPKKAQAAMVADGHPEVPKQTLWEWRERNPQRFQHWVELVRAERDQDAIDDWQAVRRESLAEIRETITQLAEKRDKISPDALGRTVKDLATAGGIANQNAQVLQGKPSEYVHNSHEVLILQAMMESGVLKGTPDEMAKDWQSNKLEYVQKSLVELGEEPATPVERRPVVEG